MAFKPGQSGNPGGRKKPLGLSPAVRRSEGLKTWAKLLALRDEKIREQTVIKENGESVVIEVVPSARELREACKLILAYCWGTPVAVGNDELERRILELEERLKRNQNSSWQSY
jgi:Family of unknown function (DUF5681)